ERRGARRVRRCWSSLNSETRRVIHQSIDELHVGSSKWQNTDAVVELNSALSTLTTNVAFLASGSTRREALRDVSVTRPSADSARRGDQRAHRTGRTWITACRWS